MQIQYIYEYTIYAWNDEETHTRLYQWNAVYKCLFLWYQLPQDNSCCNACKPEHTYHSTNSEMNTWQPIMAFHPTTFPPTSLKKILHQYKEVRKNSLAVSGTASGQWRLILGGGGLRAAPATRLHLVCRQPQPNRLGLPVFVKRFSDIWFYSSRSFK